MTFKTCISDKIEKKGSNPCQNGLPHLNFLSKLRLNTDEIHFNVFYLYARVVFELKNQSKLSLKPDDFYSPFQWESIKIYKNILAPIPGIEPGPLA